MRFFKFTYLVSLFLFALSVIITMYNRTADADQLLFGLPLSFFMMPLLLLNLLFIFTVRGFGNNGLVGRVVAWGIIVPLFSLVNGADLTDIIRVLMWPTSMLASYLLVKHDTLFFKKVILLFSLLFLISCLFYVQGKIIQFTNLSHLGYGSNAVFCVLSTLPFILCLKNKYIKIIALIVTIGVVSISNKRSALIIMTVAMLPSILGLAMSYKSKLAKVIFALILSAVFVFGFIYITENYVENKIYDRFASIREDGGSGRVRIWTTVLNSLEKSSVQELFFGHGHNAVAKLRVASAAHNDFLDVIYDYGVIVFLLYISIHLKIFKRCGTLYRRKSEFFSPYFAITTVFVVMSWISILVVQQRYLIFMAVFWGAIEALKETDNDSYLN